MDWNLELQDSNNVDAQKGSVQALSQRTTNWLHQLLLSEILLHCTKLKYYTSVKLSFQLQKNTHTRYIVCLEIVQIAVQDNITAKATVYLQIECAIMPLSTCGTK